MYKVYTLFKQYVKNAIPFSPSREASIQHTLDLQIRARRAWRGLRFVFDSA